MPLLGRGVLAIWHTITPEGEAEYWRWHDREHIPERVGVPGFLRGRRYRSLSAPSTTSISTRWRTRRRSGALRTWRA